jgi:hypothetical protein
MITTQPESAQRVDQCSLSVTMDEYQLHQYIFSVPSNITAVICNIILILQFFVFCFFNET